MILLSNSKHRRILYEGNSLLSLDNNSNNVNGQYVATSSYNTIKASVSKMCMFSFAVSGRTQTQINAAFTTNIVPMIRPNDIVFNWEGTNDMNVNGLSGADAFSNLITHCNNVKSYGGIFVVGTVTARDYAGDDADLMTRIANYNTLVRNNESTYGYIVCDIGALSVFDAIADASNTTYYKADKLHMTTAGQDLCATQISTTILTLL